MPKKEKPKEMTKINIEIELETEHPAFKDLEELRKALERIPESAHLFQVLDYGSFSLEDSKGEAFGYASIERYTFEIKSSKEEQKGDKSCTKRSSN